MNIDFNKLIEFNNKHPDKKVNSFYYILLSMIISEDVSEEFIIEYLMTAQYDTPKELYNDLQEWGFIKIIGDGYKDISLRPLGIELIGETTVDEVTELASKIRDLFPKGVKSGGYLVRSSEGDIADKLRKFFKKHKYTTEQVLKATKNYVSRKESENYAYMQRATYFIEKDGVSNLAAECDNLSEEAVMFTDTMDRL